MREWQRRLNVSDEQAAIIQAEILKPYEEKAKHVKRYENTLIAEKEFAYPLDAEAIEELQESKRLLNLRDEDVREVEERILGSQLSAQPKQQIQPPATKLAEPKQRISVPTLSFETVRVNEQGAVIETIPGKAEYFTEDLGDGVTLDMVRIPGGKFLMGSAKGEAGASDDEYPQHEVRVPEFWLGKTAVTQEQWAAVAALEKVDQDLEKDPAHFKGAKRPVEKVSWDDAIEFCKRLSQRSIREYTLPSEAQWEHACRAGTTTPFHFGPTITTDLANYRGTDQEYSGTTYLGNYGDAPKGLYREETTAVGIFDEGANAFGLYDMHGNVWEWCLDGWHDSYTGALTDASAWKSSDERKVLRGGSWNDLPSNCRAAYRGRNTRDYRNNLIGFRIVSFAPRT